MLLDDLREKARCYYGGVTATAMLKTCLTDGTAAMVWYRLAQWARRWRLEPLAFVFAKFSAIFCGCVIGRGAEFGPGFVLLHSNGVVINGRVRGGARVKIQHQVTIGVEKDGVPTLGDDVYVGAGTKILGGVHIGNGAKIGANAVVLHDVPDGATAVGVPARIVQRVACGEAPNEGLRETASEDLEVMSGTAI